MEKITNWIVEWFLNHTTAEKEDLKKELDTNYFQRGYMDSFMFIEFISEIEQQFHIEFSNEQFEDRSFSTINGLSRIITCLLQADREA